MIEEDVINAKDCYDLVKCGIQQRHIAQTKMNDFSSRSHSIFTLWIESTNMSEGLKSTKRRRLHLIDLAGSERVKKANHEGQNIQDTKNINSSLLQLGNVINALVELACGKSKIQHIPYRNDKLTFMLKDSLGGNSITSIIACISPSSSNIQETISTLLFANRAKNMKNKAIINEDTTGELKFLELQCKKLKEENVQLKTKLMKNGETEIKSEIITGDFCSLNSVISHYNIIND